MLGVAGLLKKTKKSVAAVGGRSPSTVVPGVKGVSWRGWAPAPPFHPDLVLGVATYARELFAAAGELDAVYVPVGMGSGICCIIGVGGLLGGRIGVIGVAAAQAPATALSFEAWRVVTTETSHTFADGVATRVPDP